MSDFSITNIYVDIIDNISRAAILNIWSAGYIYGRDVDPDINNVTDGAVLIYDGEKWTYTYTGAFEGSAVTGPTGISPGTTGSTGSTGPIGYHITGPTGPQKSNTGYTGPSGIILTGYTGPQKSNTGPTGSFGVIPTGPSGPINSNTG